MRKLMYGLAAASTLAMASAANATLVIGTPTTVTTVASPSTDVGGFNVTFSYNDQHAATPFEELVTFVNTLSGFYGMGVQSTATVNPLTGLPTTASDVDFTGAFLTLACPVIGSPAACTGFSHIVDFTDMNPGNDISENRATSGLFLPAGSYTIHITGTRGAVSSFDGNLSFFAGTQLPEPATWALMILGFGAVGWQLRRRRPVLAQAA
jgi:PEP-CTERM putative exosortase interaction domain